MIALTDWDLHHLHEIAAAFGLTDHFDGLPHPKAEHPDKSPADKIRLFDIAARFLIGRNALEDATRLVDAALALDPCSPDLLRFRAELGPSDDPLCADVQKVIEARKHADFQQADVIPALGGQHDGRFRYLQKQELCRAWLRKGMETEAFEVLSDLLCERPDDHSTRFLAGAACFEFGRFAEVIGHILAVEQGRRSVEHEFLVLRSAQILKDRTVFDAAEVRARQAIDRQRSVDAAYWRFAIAEMRSTLGLSLPADWKTPALSRLALQNKDALLSRMTEASAPFLREINNKASFHRLLRRHDLGGLQPETFLLPEEREVACARIDRSAEGWFVKPTNLFGGHQVRLVRSGREIDTTQTPKVVQQAVARPLLIDGHKAHWRLFLLHIPAEPSGFYLSTNPYACMSPVKYAADGTTDMDQEITNTNFHFGNPTLRIPQREDGRDGHMRPLDSVRGSCLAETGIDVFHSFKSVLAPFFAVYRSPCPYVTFMAADVVVDVRGQGWLLEFEIRPQISTGRIPMVERVHDGLATGLVPILEAYLRGLPLPRDNPAWSWVDV